MSKILVIEDEESVRTSIRDLLIEKQYEVHLAEGGRGGLEIAKKVIPDLIICDIMMNDMDGYMVIENLKKDIQTSNIPFLFLTAKADPNDMRRGMGLGADDYLLKPFKAKDLLQAIDVRLNKKEASENKFKQIWDQSRDGMCLIDSNEKICITNPSFNELLNIPNENLNNVKFNSLFKESVIDFKKIDSSRELIEEVQLLNGEIKYFSLSVSPFKSQGPEGHLCIIRDITFQKKNELKIFKSLKEKEVLLKEIHHRVKNNLQIISSLLSLQSNYLNDEKSVEVFLNSQNRIRSMSLIHEKLYQSDNLSEIEFGEYVQELANYLLISNNFRSSYITFDFDVEDFVCHIDIAVPLGIILSELITNSFKHAFNNLPEGVITIHTSKTEDYIFIVYSDDGTGLSDDFNLDNLTTLGFSLITNLSDQLNAELIIIENQSFSLELKIPLNS